jgi:hypothetical protein
MDKRKKKLYSITKNKRIDISDSSTKKEKKIKNKAFMYIKKVHTSRGIEEPPKRSKSRELKSKFR